MHDVLENEMDDGYDAPFDRKTKIAKLEKSKKKGKIGHTHQKKSTQRKGKARMASKKYVTEKREKTTGKSLQRKESKRNQNRA